MRTSSRIGPLASRATKVPRCLLLQEAQSTPPGPALTRQSSAWPSGAIDAHWCLTRFELGRCRLPVEAWLLAPCLTLQLPRSGPRLPGSPAGCQVPGPCPHLVPQASDGRRHQRPRSKGQWWWGGSIPTSLLGLRAQGAHWGRCFVRPMWHSEWTTGSFPLVG